MGAPGDDDRATQHEPDVGQLLEGSAGPGIGARYRERNRHDTSQDTAPERRNELAVLVQLKQHLLLGLQPPLPQPSMNTLRLLQQLRVRVRDLGAIRLE